MATSRRVRRVFSFLNKASERRFTPQIPKKASQKIDAIVAPTFFDNPQ